MNRLEDQFVVRGLSPFELNNIAMETCTLVSEAAGMEGLIGRALMAVVRAGERSNFIAKYGSNLFFA